MKVGTPVEKLQKRADTPAGVGKALTVPAQDAGVAARGKKMPGTKRIRKHKINSVAKSKRIITQTGDFFNEKD